MSFVVNLVSSDFQIAPNCAIDQAKKIKAWLQEGQIPGASMPCGLNVVKRVDRRIAILLGP